MRYILTVTGASGAGKDTLVDALLCLNHVKKPKEVSIQSAAFSDEWCQQVGIRELVSHTTRQPREGEEHGVAYYFTDIDEFNRLEKVEETEYAGNHYCLSASELANIPDEEWGIVIVDQHGVKCIQDFVYKHKGEYQATSVFLTIDEEISKARMQARGDKPEAITRRLKQQEERGEYAPNDPDSYYYILESTDEACLVDNVHTLQEFIVSKVKSKGA